MNEAVDSQEPITRYLRNTSDIRPGLGRLHYKAYLPRRPDGQMSVYRIIEMVSAVIVALGAQYVGKPESPLKGRCDLIAGEFFGEELNIQPDPKPHERHANVHGWTSEPRNRIVARKLPRKRNSRCTDEGNRRACRHELGMGATLGATSKLSTWRDPKCS